MADAKDTRRRQLNALVSGDEVLTAVIQALEGREEVSAWEVELIDTGRFREEIGGPAVDWLESHITARKIEREGRIADLQRIASYDEGVIDEYNNDELLRLGIGYGIPGPLSDERVRREASEILAELDAS